MGKRTPVINVGRIKAVIIPLIGRTADGRNGW